MSSPPSSCSWRSYLELKRQLAFCLLIRAVHKSLYSAPPMSMGALIITFLRFHGLNSTFYMLLDEAYSPHILDRFSTPIKMPLPHGRSMRHRARCTYIYPAGWGSGRGRGPGPWPLLLILCFAGTPGLRRWGRRTNA